MDGTCISYSFYLTWHHVSGGQNPVQEADGYAWYAARVNNIGRLVNAKELCSWCHVPNATDFFEDGTPKKEAMPFRRTTLQIQDRGKSSRREEKQKQLTSEIRNPRG